MTRDKIFKPLLAGLLLLLFTLPAVAGTGVQQMERFLKNLTTLQAGFEQSVLDVENKMAARSQGTFYLSKPGNFRWDYFEPENQLIVADGRQIWLYDSDLEQVSVSSQENALRGTPAMLLITGDPVEKHFEVIDIGYSRGFDWVELIPRDQESQFTRILLAFLRDELHRMEMADKFGMITRFQFYDIQHNPDLNRELFVFEPPHDADVFNQ